MGETTKRGDGLFSDIGNSGSCVLDDLAINILG
jgi:hypothetical protein